MNDLDVDVAGEPAVDERGTLVAALDAAERGAGDAPAGDQEARDDVERLALAGDAAHGRRGPTPIARRLDRLAHHGDVAGRLEGVVGAEAAGRLEDPLDDVGRRPTIVSVAPWCARQLRGGPRRGRRRRSARRPAGRQPMTAPSPTMPAPKTTHVEPGSTFAVFIAAPSPVERPHANSAAPSSGASGLIFASAISGITVYSAKVERAHEVAERLAVAREPRRAVGQVALVLLLADREAEVRARAAAVDALAALRREQRDDVVAGRERA